MNTVTQVRSCGPIAGIGGERTQASATIGLSGTGRGVIRSYAVYAEMIESMDVACATAKVAINANCEAGWIIGVSGCAYQNARLGPIA